MGSNVQQSLLTRESKTGKTAAALSQPERSNVPGLINSSAERIYSLQERSVITR
jgi:hypothetical protein